MNKKVLTVAQLRAIFKNCSLGFAVAGVALTAGKCEKPEEKKGKDGKSANSIADADAVKKADLEVFAKKSEFESKLSSDYKLMVAGKVVEFGALKGKEFSNKELSGLLNEKSWSKIGDQVKFTAGTDGKTFAQVMGDSDTGLSEDKVAAMFVSDAKVWKYTAAGSGPAKLEKVNASSTDNTIKTFAEAFKDALGIAGLVDKNDAKIVVKGRNTAVANATPVYADRATFTAPATGSPAYDTAKGEREINVADEFVKAAERMTNAEARMLAIENNTAEALRILGFSSVFATGTLNLNLPKVKEELAKQKFLGIVSAGGPVGHSRVNQAGGLLGLFGATSLGNDSVGKVFAYRDTTANANVYNFYKITANGDAGGLTASLLEAAGTWATSVAIGG